MALSLAGSFRKPNGGRQLHAQGVCIDDMLRLLGIDGDKIYADDDEWLQEQGSLPVNLVRLKLGIS